MLVVDGSFEEQIDEVATFIDSLDQNESKVQEKVEQCLQQDDKEAAIQAIVESSSVLSSASEKGVPPVLLRCNDIRLIDSQITSPPTISLYTYYCLRKISRSTFQHHSQA